MAITVKEIHEKEFSRQVRGYNIDEVDDFLDAIASQMEMLIRENRALAQQLEGKPAEPAKPAVEAPAPIPVISAAPAAPVAPVPAPAVPAAAKPQVDEPSYFRNLEATLRETLISAQRIADETVGDARKKAASLLAGAEEKAEAILASSKVEAESVRAQNAEVRKAAEDYRARFLRLVEDQMHVLKADNSLFE